MNNYKKIAVSILLVLVLCMSLALPVSAAKPQKSDCGLLMITTSGEDVQYCLAVCIAEEDGNFVYSGQHPIQQQVGLYASATNALEYNNVYQLIEDAEYDDVQGVYRFSLGEKVESGTEADVYPEIADAQKNDTVYFVYLDMNESDVFVVEKTSVASVRNGVLTTQDKLEKNFGNGDFSVIFNDSGDVVGFCKTGVATALASKNSGGSMETWAIAIGFAVGTVIWLIRKNRKKEKMPTVIENDGTQWDDDDSTTLDSDTIMDEAEQPFNNTLALKCHGGYLNGRIYPIPYEGITIGREPDNSIRYPGQTPGISRHHVKLFWQNNQLMLVDLGSSNGTYLNQAGRIPRMQPVALRVGDVFYLGEKLNGFEIAYN